MLGITVVSCGFAVRHPPGFAVDRPRGTPDWLLLLFITACRVGDWRFPAGTCLLHAPGQTHDYGSSDGAFANHYCHLVGPGMDELVASLGLSVGEPRSVRDPAPLADALQALWREQVRCEAGWQAAGAALAVAAVVAFHRCDVGTLGDARLADLRAELLAEPQAPWSVDRLAQRAHLSPSRLRVRWRSAFGAAPLADLIRARIARARELLEGGISVAAAAEASGFNDLPYFHRQFRRLTGTTPGRRPGVQSVQASTGGSKIYSEKGSSRRSPRR